VSAQVGYHWHLRKLMAERGLFATTALVPLLAERGVRLSREQVYRLVTGVPERLSLVTLAALCDILGCAPGDLVEPYRGRPRRAADPGASAAPADTAPSDTTAPATTAPRAASSPVVMPSRPRRAEITAVPGPGTGS
jgi:DNA-binding Xre family transcriptional regulator